MTSPTPRSSSRTALSVGAGHFSNRARSHCANRGVPSFAVERRNAAHRADASCNRCPSVLDRRAAAAPRPTLQLPIAALAHLFDYALVCGSRLLAARRPPVSQRRVLPPLHAVDGVGFAWRRPPDRLHSCGRSLRSGAAGRRSKRCRHPGTNHCSALRRRRPRAHHRLSKPAAVKSRSRRAHRHWHGVESAGGHRWSSGRPKTPQPRCTPRSAPRWALLACTLLDAENAALAPDSKPRNRCTRAYWLPNRGPAPLVGLPSSATSPSAPTHARRL